LKKAMSKNKKAEKEKADKKIKLAEQEADEKIH